MEIRAEFTVYPFRPGEEPPPYVKAAIDRLQRAGLSVEVGLLGQVVSGAADHVLEALRAAHEAALAAGATRLTVSLERAT